MFHESENRSADVVAVGRYVTSGFWLSLKQKIPFLWVLVWGALHEIGGRAAQQGYMYMTM
jgi:hypothetical protein